MIDLNTVPNGVAGALLDGTGVMDELKEGAPSPRRRRTVAERFWSHVDKGSPNGCWLWKLKLHSQGYGQFKIGDSVHKAHRIAYELTFGSPPEGEGVIRSCRNNACVNPEHMFAGDSHDRMTIVVKAGRNNPAVGERNRHAKVTAEEVLQIRAAVESGKTHRAVATDFDLHPSTVTDIVNRKIWKHV